MENLFEAIRSKLSIGEYPPQYNPKIHGPYYPNRYYGKPDIKFTQLKLSEMGQWLSRRDFHPVAMAKCLSRGFWRYQMKWLMTKKPSMAPFIHITLGISLFYFVSAYPKYRTMGHHHTKYHW